MWQQEAEDPKAIAGSEGKKGTMSQGTAAPARAGVDKTLASHRASREERGPPNTLTLAQGDPFWTSDLRNLLFKVINLGYVKPLNVW